MPVAQRRFYLQATDPDHGCPVLEAAFMVDNIEDLRPLLAPEADHDPSLKFQYHLVPSQTEAITRRFNVAFAPGSRDVELDTSGTLRDIPYLVHTNSELQLLLDGSKKFAWFTETYPIHQGDYNHDEGRFDRYVSEELLYKEVFIDPFPEPAKFPDSREIEGVRLICYTTIGEEWRVPAWRLIFAASRKSGWNESFERLEGMLFGYEEWQMDWWLRHLQDTGAPRLD